MPKRLEVYKCETCGTLAEILSGGDGALACCDRPMKLLQEGVTDAAREKHVPVIEKTSAGYTVRVGAVAHPMEEKHWIQWIELVADDISYTRFLAPGSAPEAEFCIGEAKNVAAREYCNLHGHWKAQA